MSKQPSNKLHSNQSGLVSILVSMAFIILLTLITTSFALLMRREQRQALDRQLSAQAFYAAESGINDAIKNINTGSAVSPNCSNTSAVIGGGSTDLEDGLSISCVLIDKTPSSLVYTVPKDESKIVPVLAPESSIISKIRISWQGATGQTNFAPVSSTFNFPQGLLGTPIDIGDVGLLRVSAMPITNNVSRATLTANTQTMFLYPQAGATGSPNTRAYAASNAAQGDIVSGKCNSGNTPYCSVDITNLSGTNNYYLRVKSMYKESEVTIKAYDSANNELPLLGTQAKIDSTGKANDVLRRIQVRVPINNQFSYPEFAIETADDICKLLLAIPPNTVQDDACYTDSDSLPPPPPVIDVCINIAGNQATVPAGYVVDGYGNCTVPVVDVCINIAGNQATVPAGYAVDAYGWCSVIPPPPPPCQPTPAWWLPAYGTYPQWPQPCTPQ